MAYVPVPKDLSRIKTKVAFNLTKRQLIFFAAALLVGLPLFFLLKGSTGTSLAAFVMILVLTGWRYLYQRSLWAISRDIHKCKISQKVTA